MMTNSNILETKTLHANNLEYHKIIYTGDQGVFHLKYEQYYWVINDKAYILTFTSEQDKYSGLKETAEKVMNSFMLKN